MADNDARYLFSTDYLFDGIGVIPINPSPFNFDLQNPPSHPLAVSERHRLIFVALSSDSVLTLSFDDSTLGASVGGVVHFFSVLSLCEKELNPSFSRSLNEASHVKDIRWRTKSNNSFLVLSELGKLYHGKVDGYFENVMDNVDAVEWITEGDYIVVAQENNLSILSPEFEERSRIVLSFNSWIGDSDAKCTVKVDSIRWVRRDSIIVGRFQLTEDGKEENDHVQVIRSKEGKLSDLCISLYFT